MLFITLYFRKYKTEKKKFFIGFPEVYANEASILLHERCQGDFI